MTALQIILMIIVVALLLAGGYVGALFVQHWFKTRYPDPVKVEPASAGKSVQNPPMAWWDELQVLQLRFADLQTKVAGELLETQNSLRLARSSEERARKLRREAGYDEDEEPAAPRAPAAPRLAAAAEGWEEEDTAPGGQQVPNMDHVQRLLNARRGR